MPKHKICDANESSSEDSDDGESSAYISVHWKDLGDLEALGNIWEYPAVWLRDNCQCSKCYSKHANARLLLIKDLDVDVTPNQLSVIDNHVSA